MKAFFAITPFLALATSATENKGSSPLSARLADPKIANHLMNYHTETNNKAGDGSCVDEVTDLADCLGPDCSDCILGAVFSVDWYSSTCAEVKSGPFCSEIAACETKCEDKVCNNELDALEGCDECPDLCMPSTEAAFATANEDAARISAAIASIKSVDTVSAGSCKSKVDKLVTCVGEECSSCVLDALGKVNWGVETCDEIEAGTFCADIGMCSTPCEGKEESCEKEIEATELCFECPDLCEDTEAVALA